MSFRVIGMATALATTGVCQEAQAATLVVDVTGAAAVSVLGGTGNTIQAFAIGAGSRVTAISYDVTITANEPSFLSEASVALFAANRAGAGISLTPGAADDLAGTSAYTGTIDLAGLGLDFVLNSEGILRLEYFDAFVDGGLPDSVWNGGTITVTYDAVAAAIPEPATWGMMAGGLAIVGGAIRRRARISLSSHA